MVVLCIILAILVVLEAIIIWGNICVLSATKKSLDYYQTRLLKMVANDSLIEESLSLLSEAYGMEEGDLRNYIYLYQKGRAPH